MFGSVLGILGPDRRVGHGRLLSDDRGTLDRRRWLWLSGRRDRRSRLGSCRFGFRRCAIDPGGGRRLGWVGRWGVQWLGHLGYGGPGGRYRARQSPEGVSAGEDESRRGERADERGRRDEGLG
ncbi:MAG: hypothetical protein M3Q49_09570, partial [Actinomycetota bacterium]|nr:hypothetical protein [Actinomycetota bacterium]